MVTPLRTGGLPSPSIGAARPGLLAGSGAGLDRARYFSICIWPLPALAGEYNYNISVQAYGYGTYSVVPVRVCGYPVHVVR